MLPWRTMQNSFTDLGKKLQGASSAQSTLKGFRAGRNDKLRPNTSVTYKFNR